MKIAFLVTTFPRLSETFILNQITGLIDLGCEVSIFAKKLDVTSEIHPDVEKYQLLSRSIYMKPIPSGAYHKLYDIILFFFSQVRQGRFKELALLRELVNTDRSLVWEALYRAIVINELQSYDVILCHFGINGIIGLMLRDLGFLQGKIITVFHGFDLSIELDRLGDKVYSSLFQTSDFFLPVSQYWKEKILTLGCNPSKTNVHHMGVDCELFTFIPRQPDSSGAIRLVSVCRLCEKKGLEYGIRAISKVVNFFPNLHYVIIGDGELRSGLEQLILELELKDVVTLLGWKQQNEVINILNQSHILLAPSVTSMTGDKEGIPVSIMEAMAMGMPIISTQHSGIPELVENGISGLLVPERDIDALSTALHHILSHPEIWEKMGMAGRTHVEKKFSKTELNQDLLKKFEFLTK